VPAVSSSLISPALGKLEDLPAGERAALAAQCSSLAGHLARVPDPRDPGGVRHTFTSLLLAAVAAVLAGARSFTAIGEWATDAPPRVLAALGVRYDPLRRRFQPPSEAAIRRVLEAVDPAALEAAVGSWLAARLQASRPPPGPARRDRRMVVAVDGKAVRGTRHASGDGQAVHLLRQPIRRPARCWPKRRWMARPTKSPASRRCWHRWTWPGRWSPPMRCTPSESTPSSWSPARRRITSWPSRTTSPACTPN
jgi:DDE_Tnp_1-associated